MNTGRWRRARIVRSIVPLPMIGSELAVQETMMSYSGKRTGRSRSSIDSALKRRASDSARSSVRLATAMARGCCAAKWVAASSIISPVPTSSTFWSARLGNIRPASFTAAAAYANGYRESGNASLGWQAGRAAESAGDVAEAVGYYANILALAPAER